MRDVEDKMRKLQIAMIALLLLAASMPAMAQTTIESPEVQRLISAAQSQIARAKSRIGTEKTISWRGVFLRNQLVDFGSFLRGPMTSIMVDEGLYVVTSVPDDQGRIQPVQAEIGFFATAQVARDGITLNFQIAEEESQRVLASWTASLPNSQDFHGMFISDDSGSGVFADFGEPDSMETPREWPGTGRLDQLTFHSGDDGDYFLLNPAVDELTGNYLTIETSGEIDTYIDVFEYNSRATIMSNDDGGNNMNAKVSISTDSLPVILLVRPLSSDTTGAYGLNIANIQYE
ncbi:MAG: hypothetical protein D6B26_00225, partial [Spirochaetaceae bacterium]